MSYTDVFSHSLGWGSFKITLPEERFMDNFFALLFPDNFEKWNKVFVGAISGVSSKKTDTLFTDLLYLYIYLEIIQEEKELMDVNGETFDVEEAADTYCLRSIRRRFDCYGLNINPIYEAYGLDLEYLDGIGYMSIEGESPEFIIT